MSFDLDISFRQFPNRLDDLVPGVDLRLGNGSLPDFAPPSMVKLDCTIRASAGSMLRVKFETTSISVASTASCRAWRIVCSASYRGTEEFNLDSKKRGQRGGGKG